MTGQQMGPLSPWWQLSRWKVNRFSRSNRPKFVVYSIDGSTSLFSDCPGWYRSGSRRAEGVPSFCIVEKKKRKEIDLTIRISLVKCTGWAYIRRPSSCQRKGKQQEFDLIRRLICFCLNTTQVCCCPSNSFTSTRLGWFKWDAVMGTIPIS